MKMILITSYIELDYECLDFTTIYDGQAYQEKSADTT